MPDEISTAKVAGRRKLWFENVAQAEVEIDRIVAADQAGTLRAIGNWSPGQILNHIAAWIEYGYEGYPIGPPPFFIRWLLKRMGRRYLRRGMPAGARIPKIPQGTFGQDDSSVHEAAQRAKRALARLASGERALHDSPAFGPMSHEERIQLNLRHAELHLGFLRYD